MTSTIKVNTVTTESGSTLTLGESGKTVALASGASQTGFGRTGTVDWETTPKTNSDSPVTGATGKGYFLNTTAGAITFNLPAGSAGDIVSIADYAATWATYNVTVAPDGSQLIGGSNGTAVLDTNGQSITFVYVDGVQGWVNTMDSTSNVRGNAPITATGGDSCGTDGDYKWHEFTNPGTFQITAGSGSGLKVSAVVIGGGGGGGASNGGGGGGGAGGYRETKVTGDPYTASPLALSAACGIPVTVTSYSVTVDGGGAGAPGVGGTPPNTGQPGTSGGTSIFHTLTSAGGGGGGGSNTLNACASGRSGGSGGGGGKSGSPGDVQGGTGNTPSVSPPQGNPGGNSNASPSSPSNDGSGGGGAGDQGETITWPNCRGGNGGIGVTTVITGSPISVAGGGGSNSEVGGTGGTGGVHNTGATPQPSSAPSSPRSPGFGGGNGMNGAAPQPFPGSGTGNGGCNTGGGGGGSDAPGNAGGNGGSGRVIIRYKYQNL